jgi:hypothetical protein
MTRRKQRLFLASLWVVLMCPSWMVSLDAFNILNRANYQNYLGALSSPLFGKPASALPPRRLQAGFRFQF